ncbi:LAFA_0E10594g1_1 [Lachancea sp. 'fantastica']|nr:LAFA_0E10594g1_1 [Lachancea sp. 'fantastica']
MTTVPKKRSRSPDLAGISNYKRLRLIEDLQSLSLSDNASSTSKRVTTKVVADEAWKNNQQVWKVVSGQDNVNKDIYGTIWDSIRSSNLQVIKWYDGALLVYTSWLVWFQSQNGASGSREMEVDSAEDAATYHEYNGYGYEPMLLDD